MLRRVLVSRSFAFARCFLGGQPRFLSSTTIERSSRGKIYTRGGDGGTSVLISSGATRLPKSSGVFDVLGTLDELSSVIGVVLSSTSSSSFPSICKRLESIQCDLFDIGSCVAARNRSSRFQFNDQRLIDQLEEEIDRMTDELPPLKNFILPGGQSVTGAFVHWARSVCRRCERDMTRWINEEEGQTEDTVMHIYLNRLSDYLFTLARFVTLKEGHEEIIYQKKKKFD